MFSSFFMSCFFLFFYNVSQKVWERKLQHIICTHTLTYTLTYTHIHSHTHIYTHSQIDHSFSNLGFFAPSLPANPHGLELPCRLGNLNNHISNLQVTKAN